MRKNPKQIVVSRLVTVEALQDSEVVLKMLCLAIYRSLKHYLTKSDQFVTL